jgi:hypothetical protein
MNIFKLFELFMNCWWTCSNFCGEYLNNFKFCYFFWTCSWTVHEHVIFFEHVHEQFMNMFVKTKKFELNPLEMDIFLRWNQSKTRQKFRPCRRSRGEKTSGIFTTLDELCIVPNFMND